MDIQEVMVGGLFLIAALFICRMLYRNFNQKKSCASGCNKCGVDFSQIGEPKKENRQGS